MANSVILSQVGDIILCLGNNVPAGYISLGEGTSLLRSSYSELWSWAQKNTEVLTDDAWNTEFNTNGSCAYFSSGDGSTTFRLPKIQSILKANASGTVGAFNKAIFKSTHFHGLGKMDNNNGIWGRLSYSNATYPAGSTGYFWNGSGGHSTTSTPDYSGDIITSNDMTNTSGSDNTEAPTPASVNIVLAIRYTTEHQATATILSESTTVAAMNDLANAVSSSGNIAPNLLQLDDTGYILYSWGELRQWGIGSEGVLTETIAFPVEFGSLPPTHINITIEDPDNSLTAPVTANITSKTVSSFTYKLIGLEGQPHARVRIRWHAFGRS